MSAVVNRREFLVSADKLAKASRPTPELIEAHSAAFERMLADVVEPAVTVELVEVP